MNPGALIRAALAAVLVVLVLVPVAGAARLKPPKQVRPAANAVVPALPAFSWSRVANADHYDFEIAADSGFASPVAGNEKGKFATKNTTATLLKSIPNGEYWWRVRAVTKTGGVSPWTRGRKFTMAWTEVPTPLSPEDGTVVSFPKPATLVWSPVGGAAKYKVLLARDAGLGSLVYQRDTVYTQATRFTPEVQLQPGVYYWNVTPVNAQGHEGKASPVWSFEWRWPSTVSGLAVDDLRAEASTFEPRFSWNRVPGATGYQIEVNKDPGFDPSSMVCCGTVSGRAVSYDVLRSNVHTPTMVLDDDDEYYWRVRALDTSGNPGAFTNGPLFAKAFSKNSGGVPTIANLRVRDNVQDPAADLDPAKAGVQTQAPILTWEPVAGASAYEVRVVPYQIGSRDVVAAPGTQVSVYKLGTNDLATLYAADGSTAVANPFPADGDGTSTFRAIAGSYQVRIDGTPSVNTSLGDGCNWSATNGDYLSQVSAPYWTPLGTDPDGTPPLHSTMTPTRDDTNWDGTGGWCARVRARSESNALNVAIYGDWTYLRGTGGNHDAAFFGGGDCVPACAANMLAPGDYLGPTAGTTTTRAPLFRWNDVAPAYYVFVAGDPNFSSSSIVDFAFTRIPAYAPRYKNTARTYDDDRTLYWMVLPADLDGTNASQGVGDPTVGFAKQSAQPAPIEPANGGEVIGHPTFRWTPVEGAERYVLQVASDPGFQNKLETSDVQTGATSYSSMRTYGSDLVYWRVQAIDIEGRRLTFSDPYWFTRVLSAPTPLPTNIDTSAGLPTWAWQPVDGAAAYDIEITLPDGNKTTFAKNYSTASDPTQMTGTGIFSWRVQARFPNGTSLVGGRWSALQSFSRTIPAPLGPHVDRKNGLLLAWDARPGVMDYRVEISRKEDFKTTVERVDVDAANYAPKMDKKEYRDGGVLYWRVAARDLTKNVGAWTQIQKLTMSPRMMVKATAKLKAKQKGLVRLQVTTFDKKKVNRAFVKANGATLKKPVGAFTNKSGVALLRLKPKKRGNVKITITKKGNQPVVITVKVR